MTLKQRPEKYAAVDSVEPRSTVVTTTDDVYDVFDGKISLREALVNAHPGETVAFASSLKGKTIALNSESGELTIDKSLTIDASSLRDATTSEPGLTISGGGATRILSLEWGVKDVAIKGIKFANAYTSGNGGAIYNYGGTLSLEGCAICDNSANTGAGVYSAYGDTTLTNCLVANNAANYGGGGIYSYTGSSYPRKTTLVNCTVTNNSGYYCGGIYCNSYTTTEAYNSIVYGNSSTSSGAADFYLNNSTAVANAYNTLSSFTNWTSGENNLTYDASKPLFTNASAGDYTLANDSQTIDKGNNVYVTLNADGAGRRRISGDAVDLGAYEYQFSDPTPPPVLSTPGNVACEESNGAISVSWDAVQDASGYRIAYRTSSGTTTTVDVASNLTGYSLTGLTQGETYYVKVAALGDGVTRWTSSYSEEASARLSAVIVVTSAGDVIDANDGVVTLREALRTAKSGDTITFANSLKGKTITVGSELDVYESVTIDASSLYTASTKTPGVTVSGGNSTRIMWIYGGYSVVLKGLKFVNGRSSACGGVAWNNGDLTVENCVFSDNITTYDGVEGAAYGGAIAVKSGAKLTAKSSTFTGNFGGGVVSFQTELSSTFTDCEFRNNRSEAFDIVSGKVSATNCVIADGEDYGVYVGSNGEVSLTNCSITGSANSGVYSYGGKVLATNCSITDGASRGVYANGGEVSLTNCSITGNSGGVYLSNGEASLTSCRILDNNGVGIYLGNGAAVLNATDSLVAGNSAGYGAGLELYGTATLYNCAIVGNTATSNGGGVDLDGSAVLNAYNTIIAGNSAARSGDDIYFSNSNAVANARNTLSSFADWTSGANNLTYNESQPLFTNASAKDFTLAENSQAIDKGSNQYVTTTVDLAGNARVSGGTVDLGPYEYQFAVEPETLSKPTNPRVTAKTETSITVAWDAVANASGYRFAYKDKTASSYTTKALDASTTSYTIEGLDNAATYNWRVLALGDGVNYTNSSYCATQTVTPRQKLPKPTASVAAEPTSISVSWDSVPNAMRYTVYYKLASATSWTSANAGTNLGYTIPGLESNTEYNVRVKAIGDGLDYESSSYSTTLTVTTPNPTPDPETPSTVVTTNLDVVDAYDGLVSLREALDYADSGATITFASSLKGKTIALDSQLGALAPGKSLTIDASNLCNATTSAPGLTISGQGATRILSIGEGVVGVNWITFANGYAAERGGAIYNNGATLSLSNCVIRDSQACHGGGICSLQGETTLANCTVTNNAAVGSEDGEGYGGGIYNNYSTLSLENCAISENEAFWGGGVCSLYGETTFANCAVSGNTAVNSENYFGCGGGIYHDYGTLWLEDCEISGNTTIDGFGGGVYSASGETTLTNCAISNNTAGSGGGVLCGRPYDEPDGETLTTTLTNCSITNNNALFGGGVYSYAGETRLTACTIANNTAECDGGGAYIDVFSKTTLFGCAVTNNIANGGGDSGGGGATVYGETTFAYCTITNNASNAGGGGALSRSNNVTFEECLVAGNVASWGGGGLGLLGEVADLYNCTIVGNTANYGGGVYLSGEDSDVVFTAYNTIIAGNDATASDDDVCRVYSAYDSGEVVAYAYNALTSYSDWTGGASILTYDASKPLFTNAASGDYTLADNSQAINKGNNQYVQSDADLAGNARVFGGTVDLGAYESQKNADPVQLGAPTNPRATAKTETSITLAWDAVENASGYRFIWKDKTASSYTFVTLDASQTSYELTGLSNGSSYNWKVLALGDKVSFLNSAYCATQTVKPRQKLSTPTVSASAEPTSITVSWKAVSNASRYSVYYKLASASSWSSALNAGTNLSYSITGLEPNAEYNVRVRAIGDGLDYATSSYSTTISVSTPDTPTGPIQLAKPGNPREAGKTDTTITVEWDAVANASGYRFVWKNKNDSSYTYVTLDALRTSYTLTGLETGATYNWKVQATGDKVSYLNSDFCATQTVKAGETVQLAKPVPGATTKTATSITASWDAVENASGYRFVWKNKTDSSYTYVTLGASATSYTLTGLETGATYQWKVQATGDKVSYLNSDFCATQSVKTGETVQLAAPTPIGSVRTSTAITTSWSAVANASGYQFVWKNNKSNTSYVYETLGASSTSFTLTGLEDGATYSWKVRATGDKVSYLTSDFSATQTVKPSQTAVAASSAALDLGDELFDEIDDEDYNLLAANFIA